MSTISVYQKLPDENRVYLVSQEENMISISSGLPDDEVMPRVLTFDATSLKPYTRYLVYYSNEYTNFLVSNIEDTHVPYKGSFIDLYTLSLLLTYTNNYLTIWKSATDEIFFLANHCTITFPGVDTVTDDLKFSDWLEANSTDPECVSKWLAEWDEIVLAVNERRELMFRGLPLLDAQVDILLKIMQNIFAKDTELHTYIQQNAPDVLSQFDTIAALSLYDIKSKAAIDTILSDKSRVRQIQAKYYNEAIQAKYYTLD